MNCTCEKQYTIKVTEGNEWGLLLTLKTRTYESDQPIDEDIDVTMLQDIAITVDGEEWTAWTTDDNGILLTIPADEPLGPHNVELTGTYYGIPIRAAYFECFTIMPWSYMSDAGNYLPDSPIASEAAYIYVGIVSDPELAALKAELRRQIAATKAAEEAAEAAKEEFDQKAENLDNLDNVAQQGNNPNATNTQILTDIAVILTRIGLSTDAATAATLFGRIAAVINAVGNIDFSALAKQGDNPEATSTAILNAIGNITIDTSTIAKQGNNENANITDILANSADILTKIGSSTDAATAATIFGKLAAVINAVGNIDFSTLAKQGTDNTVTLTKVYQAITTTTPLTPMTSEQVTEMVQDIISNN